MAENRVEQTPNAIEFRHVTKFFDDLVALDDVSFELPRGGMTVITGVSGSGKTVLLQLAIGLIRPDSGEILVNGRHIETLDEAELLDLRSDSMGIVFQKNALFTSLTVFENTAFRLIEHGWPYEKAEAEAIEILEFVGLDEELDNLPEELSIGMGRRLELARALVGWPSIMLFDEPTSGLDPLNEKQVMDLILRARDQFDVSSIYVTKEIHEIPYLESHHEGSTRRTAPIEVIVLDEGRIVFRGGVSEFIESHAPFVENLTHPKSSIPVFDIRGNRV